MQNDYKLENLSGDLARRIELCRRRMEHADYSADKVFKSMDYQWYGDWEGRALLAMSCLKTFYGVGGVNYHSCWQRLDSALNEQGYFGPSIDVNNINEQQLAGNSWYLRALCTEYENEPRSRILERIENVVGNLYIRNAAMFCEYPVNENGNNGNTYAAGALAKKIGNWTLSSDSGCVYIALDGLSHAYEIVGGAALAATIRRLIAQFAATDLPKKKFQAHAFLSGIRGLLRFAEAEKDESLFRMAEKYFDYYMQTSVNYIYENYGVLNSPSGSEGCAVIDEAMLCAAFYKHTRGAKYLVLYRKVYVNAIRANQRSNGGMGCDVAVGAGEIGYFASVPEFVEATWCCTMRGCEGMTDFARNLYCVDGDTVVAMLPNDNIAAFFGGAVRIEQKTAYPYDGCTVFKIIECGRPFRLKVDFFDGYETSENDGGGEIEIRRPCTVTIRHTGKIRVRKVGDKTGYERGDMILGESVTEEGKFYFCDDRKLQPLVSADTIDMSALPAFRQKLLF